MLITVVSDVVSNSQCPLDLRRLLLLKHIVNSTPFNITEKSNKNEILSVTHEWHVKDYNAT